MKMRLLVSLGLFLGMSAYAKEMNFDRKIASQDPTYVVTDMLCRSGAPVNFKTTVSPGFTFESDSDFSITTAALRKEWKDSKNIQDILNADASKLILFVSTCSKGEAYQGGKGPCPPGDQIIGVGKLKK